MVKIHTDFVGANATVVRRDKEDIYIENQLRDTDTDWFYWAFCVEGAGGKSLTFHFQKHRLGYFGPAVSHDLENWHWLDSVDGDSFTYRFKDGENKVYFAHDILYRTSRFEALAKRLGLEIRELCKSKRGRSVPCVSFGEGEISIIMTARHHACESTGSYVLEGVIEELCAHPMDNATIFCVPFVDLDGVIDGDQGKSRVPHDHNRDYTEAPIYSETAAIMAYADQNGCNFGLDFHSPLA